MNIITWKHNAPRLPDLTRAARALSYTLIDAGKQGQPPRYAMQAVCDDGEIRTFIVGPNVRKE